MFLRDIQAKSGMVGNYACAVANPSLIDLGGRKGKVFCFIKGYGIRVSMQV